ncbi:arsenate reductase (glutaredoxin) [Gaetbulibacter aquiaggeris]|uniref:Arsenate reductase (Glutaredoxin) n=1 Tax=Gaetbulibacter aquiaggeris TaxID=1735373 RepID=A0ABW7MS21_9FLAO
MIKIYHNNRCGKSRAGLKLLEDSGKEYRVINYLETVPTFEELKKIIDMLGIRPIELVRKNETIWKENFKNKTLSDEEIIDILLNNPKLIERPIVINENRGVVGRPTEKILEIL